MTGLLAACASDEAHREDGSTAEGGGTGGAAAAGITVPVADVPVGSGVIVEEVVVTQPTEGEFHAFSAVCTHQGCLVNQVTETQIVCPCHGSQFSTTDGSVIAGAAESALPAATVEESEGTLTVTPAS
ncbi:ubiquinol-cytochrome c reductase iron-sulfur subunit [Brevibacterium litoralis]|uniref:QcrA and Rieske domain-containing protein n=1 Tax=Brevibacterium litoralis TaxID=3138935 RepID=UPI0032EE8648